MTPRLRRLPDSKNMPVPTANVDEAALRRAYEAGEDAHALCVAFKIGRSRLNRYIRNGEWTRPPPLDWTKGHDLETIREAYESSAEPVAQLCARLGIAKSSMEHNATRLNWTRNSRGYRRGSPWAPKALKAQWAEEDRRARIESLHEGLGAQIRALAARPKGEALDELAQCVKTINALRAALGCPVEDEPHERKAGPEDIRLSLERRLDRLLLEEGYAQPGAPPSQGEPERGGMPVSRP